MIRLFLDRRRRLYRRIRARALGVGAVSWSRAHRPAIVSAGYVLAIVGIHTLAMMGFEGMGAGDALWLTLTSITTVGYGDLSAASVEGRAATILVIYIGGIFLVGKVAGDFFEYRVNRREMMKRGKWSWDDLNDHIVIVGTREDTDHHLGRLVAEFERHEATAGRDIVLVSESFPDGLPPALENLKVKYVHGSATRPETLMRAGVARAGVIVALAADGDDVRSDGLVFDLIHRIREMNLKAQVVAECVDDTNRDRLQGAGASLVMRPVRAYPEMIVGALLNPGVHEILENLFTARGETIRREEKDVEGEWSGIVTEHVTANRGIPIAYRDRDNGRIVTAPLAETQVRADVLFVLRE